MGAVACTRQHFVCVSFVRGMVVELGCCGAILPLAEQLRLVNMRISQLEGDKKTVVSDLGKCGYSFLTGINEQLV